MGFTETLRLLVEADAKGAISEVEKLGSTAEREANRSEKALDRWGNRMQSVGTGMMVFGAAALVGLKSAGDAASDLNEVASKSATVFGEAAGEVDEFASNAADIGLSKRAALEAASGFGNLFDQLGFANEASADMSMSLTQLASDFASFHNADITEVIEAQTAAFRGEYDSLQRFVPTINAAAVQQQAMAETGKDNADALTEAEKAAATYTLMIEGAGAATGDFARTGDSAANQQRKLNANWENLKAQLGQGVLPAMQTMLGVTNDVVGGLSDLNAVTDGTLGKIATFGAVGLVAAGGVSTLVGKVITMRENFKTAWDAVQKLRGGMSGLSGSATRAGLAFGALAIVGQTIDEISGGIEHIDLAKLENDLLRLGETGRASGDLLAAAGGDLDKLRDAIEMIAAPSTATQVKNVMEEISTGGGLLGETGHDLEEAKALVDDFDKALAQLATRDPQLAADALKQLTDQMNPEEAGRFVGLLDDYDSALAEIDTTEATSGTDELGGAMGEQSEETAAAEDALKDYQDQLKGMFDPLFAMSDALDKNSEAHANLQAKQLEAFVAQDEYNEAVRRYGENSDAARDAAANNMEAQEALADAQRDARNAVIDLDSAAADLRFEMDENGLTAEQARARFVEMATQMGYTEAQANQLADEFGFVTRKAQEVGRQHPRPTISARDLATGVINSVGAGLGAIDGRSATVTINANTIIRSVVEGFGFGGGRARGGSVSGSKFYEVVEDGAPELFKTGGRTFMIPGADGEVVPTSDVSLGSGVGMGGTTIINHVHVAGSVLSDRDLVQTINRLTARGRGLN